MAMIQNVAHALACAQVAVHYLEVERLDVLGVSVDVYAHGFVPRVHVGNTLAVQRLVREGRFEGVRFDGRESSFELHGCRVFWLS